MDSMRCFRGWMTALTVGGLLSLVFLVVEKHIRQPNVSMSVMTGQVSLSGSTTTPSGILLTVDPGLMLTPAEHRADRALIPRWDAAANVSDTSDLLRRPPEPVATAALNRPIPDAELNALPMYTSRSAIDFLMDTMDQALESPIQTVGLKHAETAEEDPQGGLEVSDRLQTLPAPTRLTGHVPLPIGLLQEIQQLEDAVLVRNSGVGSDRETGQSHLIATHITELPTSVSLAVTSWSGRVRKLIEQITLEHGLESSASIRDIDQLSQLAKQASELGTQLTDADLAADLIRTGYSLERRVAVWKSVQQCLDSTTISLIGARNRSFARHEMVSAIEAVKHHLESREEPAAWSKYLLIDELSTWAASENEDWETGNELANNVLSRLRWQRMSKEQMGFLSAPVFDELAAHLSVLGREPIDYRQLLMDLELFEQDPINRVRSSLANTVQVLRLSESESQQAVAHALNDHYRNANIRLSINGELLQRFLPSDVYEARPVRQRILGAETRGDSAVRTDLKIHLIPDPQAWKVDIEILSDLVSLTRSSKGPAVFHNTSTAQVASHRYVSIDPMGYQVSSVPTDVSSQQYLEKLSTDFDGLPIVGDFVRLMAKEQFNEQLGLSQRITRRLIARETDAEVDRRLTENLHQAEMELKSKVVGPFERLNLNPIVVAMNTTEDRLTVRYRVADQHQMAAHTPRPRAPSDSLLSLQLHQSAINNAVSNLQLSGRVWTLPELYSQLSRVFGGQGWEIPAEIPEDITVRFADTRPATVEFINGKMQVTLRILELRQEGRLAIDRFIVVGQYAPEAKGLDAKLVRDGVVSIDGVRLTTGDRLRLRAIFSKVFVSNSEIPLVSPAWHEDERAAGLGISQLEIRDGWLAVALSNETPGVESMQTHVVRESNGLGYR
ncbi:MAG: hypothetical protein KDB03_05820 [Planctomycetales bacterium]|nr:hypothetical protein [Planctomycetales bacterium]